MAELEHLPCHLDPLNDWRFGSLDRFVHDEVVNNGRVLTWQQYAQITTDDVQRIPDLRFTVDLIAVTGDIVACRLWFDPLRAVLSLHDELDWSWIWEKLPTGLG